MTIRPDNIPHPLQRNPLPVASLKLFCQVCGEREEGIVGGLEPGEAARRMASFTANFEESHRACWGGDVTNG